MGYSKNQIKKAGNSLARCLQEDQPFNQDDINAVNYWRSIHLQVLQNALKEIDCILPEVDSTYIAGRIKKFDTITNKLQRLPGSSVTSLRDIAGVRIIVDDMDALEHARAILCNSSHCEKVIDYIAEPKKSGYRAIHFEYRYDLEEHNNLRLEVQLRTKLQHSWATSVEVYDYSRTVDKKLKFTVDEGATGEFFRTVSEIIATDEKTSTHDVALLRERLIKLENEERLMKRIREINESSYDSTLPNYTIDAEYVCFTLNQAEQYYEVQALPNIDRFFDIEAEKLSQDQNYDIVLIHIDTNSGLKNLYPNYVGDAKHFINLCDKFLKQ